MEIKIENGEICTNGLGLPETVTGQKALLQRAHNRLQMKRGGFLYNRHLGCRWHDGQALTEKTAVQLAQEALLPMYPEVRVLGAVLEDGAVTVRLETPQGAGDVRILRKGEDDDEG